MAIITISRGCFSHGKDIAEQVAKTLGYECLSQEFLMEASQFFSVPEKKLMESIHDAPGILERITHAREKFLSYIRAALLEHVKKDNVVYHGYAGHLLIPGVSHVLKVRVIAEMRDRLAFLQDRKKMSRDEALDFIEREDKHRAEWNHYFFKTDMSDPQLYDMVLNIGRLRIRDACEIICTAARSEAYRTTPESEKAISDLAVSSHVKAALQEICDAEVTSDDGIVHIKVSGQKLTKTGVASPELQIHVQEQIREDLTREIMEAIKGIPGVTEVICDIDQPYYS
jgi:cytidylate kinase